MPTTRRVYETVLNGLEKIGANYPLSKSLQEINRLFFIERNDFSLALIKESTRPNYWRPDHECRACFICKIEFNHTTNRLHHWFVSVHLNSCIILCLFLVEIVAMVFVKIVHRTNVVSPNEIG